MSPLWTISVLPIYIPCFELWPFGHWVPFWPWYVWVREFCRPFFRVWDSPSRQWPRCATIPSTQSSFWSRGTPWWGFSRLARKTSSWWISRASREGVLSAFKQSLFLPAAKPAGQEMAILSSFSASKKVLTKIANHVNPVGQLSASSQFISHTIANAARHGARPYLRFLSSYFTFNLHFDWMVVLPSTYICLKAVFPSDRGVSAVRVGLLRARVAAAVWMRAKVVWNDASTIRNSSQGLQIQWKRTKFYMTTFTYWLQ